MSNLEALQEQIQNYTAEEIVAWAMQHFGVNKVALASSLGAGDQVLTAMLLKASPQAHIFTIDTGRLHQETYDTMEQTSQKYNLKYEVLFPNQADIASLVGENGPNLFYESVPKRKLCCQVRKIKPLTQHLSTLQAWICGLRKDQSVTRTAIAKIEWDSAFGLLKINPLADWSQEQVWSYIGQNNIPYNKLHDQNFPTIGCLPCTRAVEAGEDIRAGRWWWEEPEHKECGLHIQNGKLVRKES